MQKIDPKLQSSVWERVMGQSQAAPEEAAGGAVTPEELLQWMQGERSACGAYCRLARRAGSDGGILRAMAAEEARHYRALHTMYFLLTGSCADLTSEPPEKAACFNDALRRGYKAELQSAARYTAAAERWPAMADEFLTMADEETRHSRRIRTLLCRRL